MCGIFAYTGPQSAVPQVVAGLKKLEYRGYDSWGVAVVSESSESNQSAIQVVKQVGQIGQATAEQLALPEGQVAIGHTRWATHGGVTVANAHPHFSTDHQFVLAQNGVVENFSQLKAAQLAAGETFLSETDTEVIVKVVEAQLKTGLELTEAVRQAHQMLTGRNTIIVLSQTGDILAARQGSPLIVGYTATPGEVLLSSDVLSFADQVKEVVVLDNGQMVSVSRDRQVTFFDTKTGAELDLKPEPLIITRPKIDKEGYPHFMVKEIMETPVVVRQVVSQPDQVLDQVVALIKQAKQVYTIGSGTAGVAAAILAYYLRQHAGVPATSLVGADATDYLRLMQAGDVLIAPSQSGETADVLEILEAAQAKGVKIVTYVNMPASSMTRLADVSCLANAGPEVCVMSTKIFSSQMAWGYLVAQAVAGRRDQARHELQQAADALQAYIEKTETAVQIQKLVDQLKGQTDLFLLAKGDLHLVSREGMVKLIEGSYVHAHAIPAGDLKHYAITLIEKGTPVIVFMNDPQTRGDIANAAHEVRARGAWVLGISDQPEAELDAVLTVPSSEHLMALMAIIPLQLLAYHWSIALGHDPDHPRNIAKSVTVK